MTKDQARAIADAFVLRTIGVNIASDGASYETDPTAAWVFTYPRQAEDGEVTDPSHLIVEVRVSDGRPTFFNVL